MIAFRFDAAWATLDDAERRVLLDRTESAEEGVMRDAARTVADVLQRGDTALKELAMRYDGVSLDALEVPRRVLTGALDSLTPVLRRAMERAAANIESVHRAFRPEPVETSPEPGIVVGRRPDPFDRVGVYAPGGRAAYPSSVLMAAIPARAAGVREIILASPPRQDGRPASVVLAAAALADVDRVFAVGGAGAVAAMAYGTASIPRVDRVVGPGNAHVAAAKLIVSGVVGIDSPAGPSELLVIADESSDVGDVAAELVAQAEHDPRAAVVALVCGETQRLRDEIERQVRGSTRGEVITAALRARGALVSVSSLAEAVEIAIAFAPEHLLLAVQSPDALLPLVRNAGAVFLGACSSVVFGDYMTGANHVLPTAGTARFYSGLSPLDFVRWTTYQRVDAGAAGRLAESTAVLAEAEGLPAHASAARRRLARSEVNAA